MTQLIPIQNIYRLLIYAWNVLDREELLTNTDIDGLDTAGDLLGFILADEMNQLSTHGLHQTYREEKELLSTLRGRLEIWETVSKFHNRHARAICTFTELNVDNKLNQAIRTIARWLLTCPTLSNDVAGRLMEADDHWGGVSMVPDSVYFLERWLPTPNTRRYELVVDIARLIRDDLVADDRGGSRRMPDFTRDIEKMRTLFEKFVCNYLHRHSSKDGWKCGPKRYKWLDGEEFTTEPSGTQPRIPGLNTDVTCRHDNESVIIETKFNKSVVTSDEYGEMIRPGHISQLFAYLSAEQMKRPDVPVRGVLLYGCPAGESLDLSFDLRGIPVRAYALCLDRDWEDISNDLLGLLQ